MAQTKVPGLGSKLCVVRKELSVRPLWQHKSSSVIGLNEVDEERPPEVEVHARLASGTYLWVPWG